MRRLLGLVALLLLAVGVQAQAAPSWSVFANPAADPSITTILPYELDATGHATAATRVLNAGANHFYYLLDWSAEEATTGVFTDTLLDRVVAQSGSLPIWLNIAVVNTDGARHVPSGLTSTAWDNSAMTTAFNAYLDHIQPRMGGRLQKLFIGNEADNYFTNDPTQIAPYATFFSTVRTHARTVFDPATLVMGVTFTEASTSHFGDYSAILSAEDIAPFTYYFLSGNSFVTDLGNIITAIGAKPWAFQELGFTSNTGTWGSSATTQSSFIDAAFSALPQFSTFVGATWFQLSDFSTAVLTSAGYTTPTLEFYTQIGLRDTNNQAKVGWPNLVHYLGGVTGDPPVRRFRVLRSVVSLMVLPPLVIVLTRPRRKE